MYSQPIIKQIPPIGVIAPNILILVIANAYRLKENSIIPIRNKYPDRLKLESIKIFDNIPFIINKTTLTI